MATTIQTIETPKRARALDTSGNNNHGQIYSGRALEFDGITDYLDIGTSTTFVDFSAETTQANRAWTVAAWVNLDSFVGLPTILGDGSNTYSSTYLSFSGSKMQIWDVVSTGSGDWRQNNTALKTGVWYRTVWVFDGDTTVTFYVNGVADGTGEINNTGDNADLTMRYIGMRNPSGTGLYGKREFGGKMADLQLWQGAWTADDASYDYLNPESLVLSRGGTSLTNSNLLAWYPMQDSHRGHQSYILDASNTSLGDELIPTILGGTDTWTISNASGHTIDASKITITDNSDGSVTFESSDNTNSTWYTVAIPFGGVNKGLYKLDLIAEALLSDADGYVHWRIGNAATNGHNTVNEYNSFAPSEGKKTVSNYFRFEETSGTGYLVGMFKRDSDQVYKHTLHSLSLKPVNVKNNAATVFFGDELWDKNDNHINSWVRPTAFSNEQIKLPKDRDFSAASNWVNYAPLGTNPTFTDDGSGKLTIQGTSHTHGQGAKLTIAAGCKTPVIGTVYQIAADIWWNTTAGTSSSVFKIGYGGATTSAFAVTATSATSVVQEVIATTDDGELQIYYENASTTEWFIDNVSVIPIGKLLGGVDDGIKLDFNSHTSTHGSYIRLRDAGGLNSDLTIGRNYRVSGLFAATNTSGNNSIAVYRQADATWNESTNITATNLIQNEGFETAGSGGADIWANWTEVAGSGTLANDTSNQHNGSDCASLTTVSTNTCNIHQSVTVTAEKTYLVSYWSKSGHASDSGSLRHRVLNASDSDSVIVDSSYSGNTTTNWRQTVFQFTTPEDCTSVKLVLLSPASNYTALADDVLITAFVERSIDFAASGTTVDYLAHRNTDRDLTDCMIEEEDNKNQIFDEGSSDWGDYSPSSSPTSVAIDSGRLKVYSTSATTHEGAALAVDNFSALEVGKSYTVKINLEANSGTPAIFVGLGGASSAGQKITTDADDYDFTVTPVNTTSSLLIYTVDSWADYFHIDNVQLFPNHDLYYDDISVKEIGVASGWTDAGEQLHIPQLALQSYNEFAYSTNIDGKNSDNLVANVNHHVDFDIVRENFTISCWVFLDSFGDGNGQYIFHKSGGGNAGWHLRIASDGEIWWSVEDDDNGGESGEEGTNVTARNGISGTHHKGLQLGRWHHIVCTFKYNNTGGMRIYLDGEILRLDTWHTVNNAVGTDRSVTSTDQFYMSTTSITGDINQDGADKLTMMNWATTYSTGVLQGTATEFAVFKGVALNEAAVEELYNDGRALDATQHSQASSLKGYWRNEGLSMKWHNLVQTNNVSQLDEELDDNETTVTVDTGSNFTTGDVIIIDSEQMLVTNVSSNDLTVTRGYRSKATGHANDTKVHAYLHNADVTDISETREAMIIPAGANSFRDSQGFIMNKRRNTSSLNLPNYEEALTPSSSYVDVGKIITDDIFSICLWFKTRISDFTSANQYIIDNRDSSDDGWLLYIVGSNDRITFKIGDGTDTLNLNSGKLLIEDTWTHVAVTYAGTGNVSNGAKTYINGVPAATGTATNVGAMNITTEMRIGARNFTSPRYPFRGQIDNVLYYTDVLSDAEILQNYNATKGSHRN